MLYIHVRIEIELLTSNARNLEQQKKDTMANLDNVSNSRVVLVNGIDSCC